MDTMYQLTDAGAVRWGTSVVLVFPNLAWEFGPIDKWVKPHYTLFQSLLVLIGNGWWLCFLGGFGGPTEDTFGIVCQRSCFWKDLYEELFFLKGGMLMMMSPSFGFGKEWGL